MAGDSDTPESLGDFSADIDLDREISEEVERQIATPETHDLREVQDRTGLKMFAVQRNDIPGQLKILGPYAHLKCPRCNSEHFRVLCGALDNFLMIVCAEKTCGAVWPCLEVNPVQMNDRVAQEHGLWIPNMKSRRN